MAKCEICFREFETNRGLSIHLYQFHHFNRLQFSEYYDKYLLKEDKKCPICKNEREFMNINVGYRPTCSNKECIKINRNKKKIITNNIIRHCDNPFQSEECKEKCGDTKELKYHNRNFNNRKKAKVTYLEKTGYDNPKKNPSVIKEEKEKNMAKYNVTHPMKLKEFWSKAVTTKRIDVSKRFVEMIFEKSKNAIPLFEEKDYVGRSFLYPWKCNICGNEFTDYICGSHLPRCMICFPHIKGRSKIEKEIYYWLKNEIKLNLNEKDNLNKRLYFGGSKYMELDIYMDDKKIGIELDSIYWHSQNHGGKDKNYHIDKTKFFNERGIHVIHIFDNEWNNNQDIVKNIILSKLGLIKNKIYARRCEIKEIKNVKEFLDNNHLQGTVNSSVNIGLYYKDELVQLLTFGKPRFNKNYKYELLRSCSKLNHIIVGGFSKLLKYFVKNYSNSLITYCDLRYSMGEVYYKNNFKLLNISYPNYFYTKDYENLESRIKYQKYKLRTLFPNFDESLTEWENMKNNDFDRIWDCGNLVFEYVKKV
jgi:hypothetical protein